MPRVAVLVNSELSSLLGTLSWSTAFDLKSGAHQPLAKAFSIYCLRTDEPLPDDRGEPALDHCYASISTVLTLVNCQRASMLDEELTIFQ